MDWEKALLKIDVVKDKKNIICDINGISKNPDEGVCGINNLIAKYKEPKHRCFIQKYVETQLATAGTYLTIAAYFIALVSILIALASILITFVLSGGTTEGTLLYAFLVLLVVSLLVFFCFVVITFVWIYFYLGPRIDQYKAIIIAIEAAKLGNQRKNTRDIAELNKKDTKIICILILFLITICQSFIILALIFP